MLTDQPPDLTRRNILLVEDEPNLREQIRFLLDAEGYTVETAENGVRGLVLLKTYRPDIIIADVRMPEMDGFEFCRNVRETRLLRGVPFIFLTARDAKEDRLKGRALGADDYLTKPFEIDELLAVVESRLRRTHDLTNEVEDRFSEQVAKSLSHELRTPLTIIQGLISLLNSEEELDESTQKEFFKTVIENGEQLNRQIENLLQFKETSQFSEAPAKEPTDIRLMVEEACRIFLPIAERKRIHFERTLAEPLPAVVAHRPSLLVLLTNLIDNAVKFTPDGGRVDLTVAPATGGGALVIIVADTGVGIAPDRQATLFRHFYRQESSAHSLPGTGVGLGLCRRIAEWHGGSISLESAVDRGTRIVITLPTTPSGHDAVRNG